MDNENSASLPALIVLLVDDDPLIITDTSDMISNIGYQVIEARTADDALAFLKQHSSIELRFTDVQM